MPAAVRPRDVRLFGLVALAAGALLAHRLRAHGAGEAAQASAVVAGGAVCLLSLASPTAALPLYRAWMALGHAMGRVTTPVVIAVVYFGLMTPIRALLSLLGKDVLAMKREPSAPSYWVERPKKRFERRDFERMA